MNDKQKKYVATNGQKIVNNKIVEEYQDVYSNCCEATFEYPGWPDNDICTRCGDHAILYDNNEEDWDDDEFCRHSHTTGGRCLNCGFDSMDE